MNPNLRTFYNNENQREAVKEFMLECLKEMAVDKSFKGESTDHIKDCKQVVENTFTRLREIYGKQPKPSISNSR